MAVIKAINSKASIGKAIKYVTQDEKTDKSLVSGIDCCPGSAIDEMKATKLAFRKIEGRQYKHFVQSFDPEDHITPEQAHKIGHDLFSKIYKGHEMVLATHIDKGHIHNHVVINSVNWENGNKLQQSKKDLENIKNASDKLCEQNGLSVIEKGKSSSVTAFDQGKYQMLLKGITGKEPSYLIQTVKDVKNTLGTSKSKDDFLKKMEEKGYLVNWSEDRKNVTFTTAAGKKVRNSNLTNTFKYDFSKENMENEFRRNHERAIRRSANESGQRNTNDRTQYDAADVHGNGQNKVPTQSDVRVLGEIEQAVHDAATRIEDIFRQGRSENSRDDKGNGNSEKRNEQDRDEGAEQLRRDAEKYNRKLKRRNEEYDLER